MIGWEHVKACLLGHLTGVGGDPNIGDVSVLNLLNKIVVLRAGMEVVPIIPSTIVVNP